MESLKFRKFPFSHGLISFLRDKDIRGIRRLSVILPQLLLPKVEDVGEHIIQTIHGFNLKINPCIDNGVELSLYQTGTYEKGILSLLSEFLKLGDVFIDVGANIGLMSIYASKLVGEFGCVIAFEAHPETNKILEYNFKLNKIENYLNQGFALGSSALQTVIYDNWQINRGGASLVINTKDSKSYPVEVHTLDCAIGSENIAPKVIKIDVEGFELEVLKGAKETIIKYQPILIIELSSQRDNNYEINELMDYLDGFGIYNYFKLKGTKERVSKLIQIHSREELPEHDNIICQPK